MQAHQCRMQTLATKIETRLLDLQDLQYREFVAKLTPSIPSTSIIGVRTPQLRQYAAELSKTSDINLFLNQLPHHYYEENNLHAILLQNISKDIDVVLDYINDFLPYVDNWATCDILPPKILKKYPSQVRNNINCWLKSNHTYTIRFGIVSLLKYFLDDDYFDPSDLITISKIHSKEYYINMAIAWYYSFALIKQYRHTLPVFENKILDKWVHNKSIQKACESYRIPPSRKEELKKQYR